MSIQHATFDQIHELHETANRIRRLVCEMFFNAQRVASPTIQDDALKVNKHRLHELLEELALLDDQIAEVPSGPGEEVSAESEAAQ